MNVPESMTLLFSCIVCRFAIMNTLLETSSFPCKEDKPEKLSMNLTFKSLDGRYSSSKTSKQAIEEMKPKPTVNSFAYLFLLFTPEVPLS